VIECDCGGSVERLARPGRTYLIPGTGLRHAVPDDLALLACRVCGDLWTDGADSDALELLARASWIEQVTATVRAEQERAHDADDGAWTYLAALLPALWDAGIRAESSVAALPSGGPALTLRSAPRHVPRKVVMWMMRSTVVASLICQGRITKAGAPADRPDQLLERVQMFLRGDDLDQQQRLRTTALLARRALARWPTKRRSTTTAAT
jgi:hypothetical protein